MTRITMMAYMSMMVTICENDFNYITAEILSRKESLACQGKPYKAELALLYKKIVFAYILTCI